jgi:O-Antigen ligase
MRELALESRAALDLPQHAAAGSHAVLMLQLFALTVMVLPSDAVIEAIGATGYLAALIGMFMFAVYLAASLFGLHNPLRHRHPIRSLLCLLWLAALASYVLMDRTALDVTAVAGADRMLMQLAVVTGVALIAAECLRSLHDVRRVLRTLCWGGAFCGVVAALQYWTSLDIAPYLRELPGFSLNFDNPGIIDRAALNRVSGTAIHPIELGVVAGMLLPLSIYLAICDTDRGARSRWAPVALIAIGISTSVSRSAILAAGVALLVLVALMPNPQRLVALAAVPFAVVVAFMSAPGLISTLGSFFGAGTSDLSVATRVSDYPLVERLVHEAPWFGQGGGTYIPDNVFDILDNQYLKTAIELGLVGVVALAAFFLVPVVVALVARRRSGDPELCLLCAALSGAALAAAVCSFTFDSLSFPMFANVHALVIGLIGAGWRLAAGHEAPASPRSQDPFNHLLRRTSRTTLPAEG